MDRYEMEPDQRHGVVGLLRPEGQWVRYEDAAAETARADREAAAKQEAEQNTRELRAELESAAERESATLDEIRAIRRQLPEGMEHCTIRFKQCEKGHGWLTATNWAQHGCPTCERDRLRAELAALRGEGPTT